MARVSIASLASFAAGAASFFYYDRVVLRKTLAPPAPAQGPAQPAPLPPPPAGRARTPPPAPLPAPQPVAKTPEVLKPFSPTAVADAVAAAVMNALPPEVKELFPYGLPSTDNYPALYWRDLYLNATFSSAHAVMQARTT